MQINNTPRPPIDYIDAEPEQIADLIEPDPGRWSINIDLAFDISLLAISFSGGAFAGWILAALIL